MIQRRGVSALAVLTLAVGVANIANAQVRYDVQAYIETYNLTNIGQAVAHIPPNSGFNNGNVPGTPNASLGPVAPLPGPISTGVVTGYFDIGCPTVGVGCDTTAYFEANHAYRWGVLDVASLTFLTNSNGDTAFTSSLGDSGFTAAAFAPAPNTAQRDVQIMWNVEDSDPDAGGPGTGVTLLPGGTYVFFAVLADPTEYALQGGQHFGYADGDPFTTDPAGEIHANATDVAPFQFHSGFPVNFYDVTDSEMGGTQTATSRLIPVVPEPGTMVLLVGGLALIARRRLV
jgi:hypothetical protein